MKLTCSRCKGKGVLIDELDVNGGVFDCVCNGTGQVERMELEDEDVSDAHREDYQTFSSGFESSNEMGVE